MPCAKTIYVVDDDDATCRELKEFLRELGHDVRVFASAEAFLAGASLDATCCVLLDMFIPGRGGLEVQELLAARRPEVSLIFTTVHCPISLVVRAMKAGAVDVLAKPVGRTELHLAVELALAQSEARQVARMRQALASDRLDRLTPREREVLALVLAGKRNKQIAGELASQEATVKVHRSRLMRKLEARTPVELLQFAPLFGLPAAAPAAAPDEPPRRQARADVAVPAAAGFEPQRYAGLPSTARVT